MYLNAFRWKVDTLETYEVWLTYCKEQELKLMPMIYKRSPYRAVNTLRLGYKNQSVNAV
jgi:hypothetical protein